MTDYNSIQIYQSPDGETCVDVKFRRWATQRLRDYLIRGYSINQQWFEENAIELKQALALIQKAHSHFFGLAII